MLANEKLPFSCSHESPCWCSFDEGLCQTPGPTRRVMVRLIGVSGNEGRPLSSPHSSNTCHDIYRSLNGAIHGRFGARALFVWVEYIAERLNH